MNPRADSSPGSNQISSYQEPRSGAAALTGSHGSYQVETFGGSLESEIRRLDAQVDLFWHLESAILDRVGIRDGMDVLDCGCGPGRLLELLVRGKPNLRCVGLEIDPVLVEASRNRFERENLENCKVVQGSATDPELPPESFDFIVLRLVLEHIPDPVAALRRMSSLLRPNGRIVVISNDFEFHLRTWPNVPELEPLYEAYCASRRKDGGDPHIGRRMPALLREAGLAVASFETETAHNTIVGDGAFLSAEGAGIPAQLVQSGFLSEQVFQSMVESWRRMLEHPDHVIMRPLFVAVGEKSDPRTESTDFPSRVSLDAVEVERAQSFSLELNYVAPSTDLEKQVAKIWGDVLGLEAVGVDSNFFDVGGTSLALGEIEEELRKQLGADLSMAVLFQYPTIRALATYLVSRRADSKTENKPTPSSDRVAEQARRRRQAAARRRR